ncbi:STAS domain-containing protein [Euzebya tangerina]|uniref:STAS domain-containing protein n=1 Tax=Euzebya tangerina TaxID=591198 RepID=UPI000E31B561|nr:STAS domain-containing protein [Euzebya tangerina]
MTIDDRDDDRSVVAVSGEVDVYTAPTLREHLNGRIADGATDLVVDLSDVGFMDSTGLGVLVGALKRLRQAGGDMQVICTSEPVLKIFRITGLEGVLGVVTSPEELSSSD